MKRWLWRITKGTAVVLVGVVAAVIVIYETGLADQWIRNAIISGGEQASGARITIGNVRFHLWTLRFEIDDLTVRGLEAATQPPLFHTDHIDLGVHILSFFGRQIALDDLTVLRPEVAIRIDRQGLSNIPSPKRPASNRPWRTTLFNLRIGHLEIHDGMFAYNDARTPLSVDGHDFNFRLHYDAPASGPDSYVGNLQWQQVRIAAKRDTPFPIDLAVKFTLHRDSFDLNELALRLLDSTFHLQATLASFAEPNWDLKYRGSLSLADVRHIMKAPTTPDGDCGFSGQAHYRGNQFNADGTAGRWTAAGYYSSRNVALPYRFYHEKAIETSGDYTIANKRLLVPNLSVHALGGTIEGQVEMVFPGLVFTTKTHARDISLDQLFAALDNDELPVRSLHWDGTTDVVSTNTWNKNFKNFRTVGEMRWTAPDTLRPGMIPAMARVDFDYNTTEQIVSITRSDISTPSMQLHMDGTLGEKDSALEVKFSADNLLEWDDFIAAIRGPEAGTHRVGGKATWRGRVIGPLIEASFVGHVLATNPQYDHLTWDELDGDMDYSPDGFTLKNAVLRRGNASSTLTLALNFAGNWNFTPSSKWQLDAHFDRATGDDLQAVLEASYPISVEVSGDLHGAGTRAAPIVDANFIAQNVVVSGWQADRLSGDFHWEHDLIKLSNGELSESYGTARGDFSYRPNEQQVEFSLTGHEVALDRIRAVQTASVPIAGRLDFDLSGGGSLLAPVAQGDLKVTNLVLRGEPEGDFAGRVVSDGQSAHLTLGSDPASERLQGDMTIGFGGDRPVSGHLSVRDFNLDPFIAAGLHTSQLTGHGSADATFTISGALRQPDSVEIDADIARISFNYQLVQLTNDQNIRIVYRRNEIRIEQARLHGPDTDVQISGSARFDRDRRLDFALSGGVNLRLVAGFVPDLHANGRADANVAVQGTMASPRVIGRVTVRDASATYGDFPLGLSHVSGDLVFDKSRLLFDGVTAQAGGGQLTLSGNVSYAEMPIRYQVTAATSTVRIRYPTGMSWLAGGTLELSGTPDAALVSGRVEVQRVLFAQGVDVASFFASTSDATPSAPSTSPFLQNLAFDIEGQTTPGARIEWTGAHVEMDGNVRLRGTWDRPVLLGDIHLLGGEMPFRGNTFELTRGDINFANPFRLDPVLNVEATSTINQYQVTIDFSGPSSHLALNYRSDPPLPDSDIVALLALGSPGEESGLRSQAGGTQNYGATALLSEAISSGIGGRIEHLFGISSFRVDPFVAETATESNAAARVTIQEQVTHDLAITYSTNAATTNQYQLIQVEYTIKPGLSVEFLRDINGTYGGDIKWVKHFK